MWGEGNVYGMCICIIDVLFRRKEKRPLDRKPSYLERFRDSS